MYEPENDQLLFSSLIKINYDKRFIRVAQNFIESLSTLTGANKDESFQISLLIEECLAFIIDKYIDCRMAAHIQICFKANADKTIRIEIEDIGPPIHESKIPSFDVKNENSEAGLWYKIARKLADKFVFVNQLSAGWLIRIDKKIANITFSASGDDVKENGSVPAREQTFGEKHTRPATVDDMPALIDLAYMTYRYSYMFSDFYDGELLKKQIEEQLCEITLIEHGNKVIGAFAIKYPDAARTSAEVGNAMIAPEYRSGSAGGMIFREVINYVQANPHHCDFFMSYAVTSHIRSQKMLGRVHNGFKPLMICLNKMPQPTFVGITHKAIDRETGLCVYHLNQKMRLGKLYAVTASHSQIINELIAGMGNDVDVRAEFAEPENVETPTTVERSDSLRYVTFTIESVGRDWFTSLSGKIFTAISSGMESVTVTIPSGTPLPQDMAGRLKDLNLVFCGLSLRSLDRIDHTYCLSTRPVNFEQIKLHDPVSRKLLAQMEQAYCRAGLKVRQ